MLLVANLGFENELAAGKVRPALGRDALQAATRAGALMRVLAVEGDTVWLPGPPGSLRMPPVPGLPAPDLIHGPLPRSWDGPVLAWGETEATAALGAGFRREGNSGSPVLNALLSAPKPDPEAARQANSKALLEPQRADLGCSLPGSGRASREEDLLRLVGEARRIHGPACGWVLKGEYSAAGRERLFESGGAETGPEILASAARLFRRHGVCLFEPWLRRTADFGCSLLIDGDQVRLTGVHRLLVSDRGRFQGVETVLPGRTVPGPVSPDRFEVYLSTEEAARMATVAGGTAAALGRIGYRGHVGIDFWRYVTAEGEDRINLLGEINARLTFGLVAGVLAQRVGAALGTDPGTPFRLWFGPEPRLSTGRRLPLVAEGPEGASAITLSVSCSV